MNTAQNFIEEYVRATTFDKFDQNKVNIPAFNVNHDPASILGAAIHDVPTYVKSDLFPLDPNIRERWQRKSISGKGVLLATSLPDKLMSFDALLNGEKSSVELSELQRLTLALKYSAQATRWEPNNTYQIHRNIASPRCLFTCSIKLAIKMPEGHYSLYSYLEDDHCLLLEKKQMTGTEAYDAPVVIGIIGDLAKCVQPYGDFAPNLVAPEAGLLISQLQFMFQALGWQFETELAVNQFEARKIFDVDAYGQSIYALSRLTRQLVI